MDNCFESGAFQASLGCFEAELDCCCKQQTVAAAAVDNFEAPEAFLASVDPLCSCSPFVD